MMPEVMVVSAMGKTTNHLEEVVDSYVAQEGNAMAKLDVVRQHHFDIVRDLGIEGDIRDQLNDVMVEAEWLLEDQPVDSYDYIYDQVVSIGELLSTIIVNAYLQSVDLPVVWLDIRDVLKTDDTYRNGQVDWHRTGKQVEQIINPLLEKGTVLTQGFIAGTSENHSMTLGREGSDYTAAILANCLGAQSVTAWKDVPGIMTEDPNISDQAQLLPRLSYAEAVEMTYYGAKVIHPRTLKPLKDKEIPLYVRSFLDPQSEGTLVSDEGPDVYPPVKVRLKEQALIQIRTRDSSFVVEDHLSQIFGLLVRNHIRISLMKNLAVSFSLVVNDDITKIDSLLKDLEEEFTSEVKRPVELLTIRHYSSDQLDQIREQHRVLISETSFDTAQLVLKG